jgi:hypothetical protein
MNICLQLLLYATIATPEERHQMRDYWRWQRLEWVRQNIIREMTPEEEALDREMRKQEGRDE